MSNRPVKSALQADQLAPQEEGAETKLTQKAEERKASMPIRKVGRLTGCYNRWMSNLPFKSALQAEQSPQASTAESHTTEKTEKREAQQAVHLTEASNNNESLVAVEQTAMQLKEATRPRCLSLHQFFKKKQPAEKQDESEPPQRQETSQALVPAKRLFAELAVEQQPREPKARGRKGGRPPKAVGAEKTKYTSLTGQQRLWAIEFVSTSVAGGSGLRAAQKAAAAKFGCNWSTVKRAWQRKTTWEQWGKDNERTAAVIPGTSRKRGERLSKLEAGSRDKGCREAGERGYLGRTDYCRPLVQKTKSWAELEAEQGHELGKADLLKKFRQYLDSAVAMANDAAELGILQPELQKELEHLTKKKQTLDTKQSGRDWQSNYLVGKCGFLDRKKQRTTALSPAQEQERVERGWKHWDFLLHKVGCSQPEELREWVAQPERFYINRKETVISMSDQVPVWLKPETDKRLVLKQTVQASRWAKKKRASRKAVADGAEQNFEAAEAQPRQLVTALGNPSNSRSRFTLVARQLVLNFFDPDREPEG